jgi:peptide/nickel transport system permease protein
VSDTRTSGASPGLWALAWRRLRRDRVAVACLFVVAAFLALMLGSMTGLVAADWEDEAGISYARPALAQRLLDRPAAESAAPAQQRAPAADLSDIDPLAPRYDEWRRRPANSGDPAVPQ